MFEWYISNAPHSECFINEGERGLRDLRMPISDCRFNSAVECDTSDHGSKSCCCHHDDTLDFGPPSFGDSASFGLRRDEVEG